MANESKKHFNWQLFPIELLVIAAYLLMGFLGNLWHPGWIVFLVIPMWRCSVDVIVKKRTKGIGALVATFVSVIVYVVLGCVLGLWHPTWIIFLSVPIAASMEAFVRSGKRGSGENRKEAFKRHIKSMFVDDEDVNEGDKGDIE